MKPFQRSLCPRRFSTKSDVAKHERTHTGTTLKPRKCTLCVRLFTANNCVIIHERTHMAAVAHDWNALQYTSKLRTK